jgi:hypothetical protein
MILQLRSTTLAALLAPAPKNGAAQSHGKISNVHSAKLTAVFHLEKQVSNDRTTLKHQISQDKK